MRLILLILVLLTLVAAYVGGLNSRGISDEDLLTVASFERSLAERDALLRSYGFTGFLPALSPDNLEQTLELLEENRRWLSRRELRNFMLMWTRFDSRGALDWALSQTGRFREDATAAAIWAWAFNDSAAAQQALNSLDAVDATQLVRDEFVLGWLWGKSPGAADYIAQQPAGIPRQKAISALTVALMREGPESVTQWADAIPDDAAGDYKSSRVPESRDDPGLRGSGHSRPAGSKVISIDGYSARALSVISSQWVQQDPAGGARLARRASRLRGDRSENALGSAFRRWLKRDPEAAEEWSALGLSRGGGRSGDPDPGPAATAGPSQRAALVWAQRIHDPIVAAAGSHQTPVRSWFRADPEAVCEVVVRERASRGDPDRDPEPARAQAPVPDRSQKSPGVDRFDEDLPGYLLWILALVAAYALGRSGSAGDRTRSIIGSLRFEKCWMKTIPWSRAFENQQLLQAIEPRKRRRSSGDRSKRKRTGSPSPFYSCSRRPGPASTNWRRWTGRSVGRGISRGV